MDHRLLYCGYGDLNLWACGVGTSCAKQRLDTLPAIAGKGLKCPIVAAMMHSLSGRDQPPWRAQLPCFTCQQQDVQM